MERKLLTSLLLILSSASTAGALRCHACAAQGICDGDEMGELRTCPSNFTGYVASQCIKFDGGVTGSVAGAAISFEGIIRSCNLIPESIDPPPLKCFADDEATGYFISVVRDLVPRGTAAGDVANVTITGDLCYCADDGCNGVDSLKPFLWLILASVGVAQSLLAKAATGA